MICFWNKILKFKLIEDIFFIYLLLRSVMFFWKIIKLEDNMQFRCFRAEGFLRAKL